MMIHSTIGCVKSVFFVMVLFGAMLYIFGILPEVQSLKPKDEGWQRIKPK